MLSALRPATLAAAALPARRPDEAARCASSPPRAGLPVAAKRESQDLCFLAGEGKRSFLARHAGLARATRGDRRLERAGSSGATPAHHNFTVGQRRGLGVAGGAPLYVLATDAATNRVVVGPREELATQTRAGARRRCCAATASASTA